MRFWRWETANWVILVALGLSLHHFTDTTPLQSVAAVVALCVANVMGRYTGESQTAWRPEDDS